MRYMFLIYSREAEMAEASAARQGKVDSGALGGHGRNQEERDLPRSASRLHPTATATTIRTENGKPLILDGPFAETKEQLAGYYILDCADLDEAIGWAAKIPTACKGGEGCVEIRPIANLPPR